MENTNPFGPTPDADDVASPSPQLPLTHLVPLPRPGLCAIAPSIQPPSRKVVSSLPTPRSPSKNHAPLPLLHAAPRCRRPPRRRAPPRYIRPAFMSSNREGPVRRGQWCTGCCGTSVSRTTGPSSTPPASPLRPPQLLRSPSPSLCSRVPSSSARVAASWVSSSAASSVSPPTRAPAASRSFSSTAGLRRCRR